MRGNEVCVVPLRSPEALMAEQKLDAADIGAVTEQLDGEGIPEPVWVQVKASEAAYCIQSTPETSDCRFKIGAAGPEEVLIRFVRHGIESGHDVIGQFHLNMRPCLFGAQPQVSGFRFQRAPHQVGRVADPQPAVDQEQAESSSSQPGPENPSWVGVVEPATRIQDAVELASVQRPCTDIPYNRRPEATSRVVGHPTAANTERKECPEDLEFLSAGAWAEGLFPTTPPASAKLSQALDGAAFHGGNGARQVRQADAVRSQCGAADATGSALGKESLSATLRRPARHRYFRALHDLLQAFLGLRPIRSPEAQPDATSIENTVRPNRAAATLPGAATLPELALSLMTPGEVHGSDSMPDCHVKSHAAYSTNLSH